MSDDGLRTLRVYEDVDQTTRSKFKSGQSLRLLNHGTFADCIVITKKTTVIGRESEICDGNREGPGSSGDQSARCPGYQE